VPDPLADRFDYAIDASSLTGDEDSCEEAVDAVFDERLDEVLV
jgi:hypothetical protein